jgi:type I restriction enzyme S subunit
MAKLSSSNGIEKFPKLRFPEFKEPWNLVKLEDVCSYRKGRAKVKKAQYISTENILQNYAGIEPYDDLSEAEGISIQCGDTLMANIRPYLKKVWQSNFNGACSTDVLAFSPDNIDGKFLYFLIAQDRFVNYVMCGAKGSKMPRGDKNHILEYETGVPTESEQRKIAHFIDLLNARISSQNSLINLIKKYKRGLSNKLFEDYSNNWIAAKFADVFKLLQNNTFSRAELTCEETEILNIHYGDVLIKYGDILDLSKVCDIPFIKNNIDLKRYSETSYLKNGDVVIADTAEDYTVGKTIEIFSASGKRILSGLHTIPCRSLISFEAKYLGYYLNSYSFRKQILPLIQGTKVSSISKSELQKVKVKYPEPKEQKRIVSILSLIDEKIYIAEHQLTFLKICKDGLLQQMFI